MSGSIVATGTPGPSTANAKRPWYRHLIYSAVAIVTGAYLIHVGQVPEGTALMGAGVAFLGIGSGVEASASSGSGGA